MNSSTPTANKRQLSSQAQIASAICSLVATVVACLALICSLVTATAACCGVISFYRAKEAAKLRDAEDSIARLYPLDINVNERLGNNPEARAALHDDPAGQIYLGLKEPDKTIFAEASDVLGDVFEYYLLIRDHISCHPRGADILQSWDKYFRTTCRNSYGFREQINAQRDTWTQLFLTEFDNNTRDLQPLLGVLTKDGTGVEPSTKTVHARSHRLRNPPKVNPIHGSKRSKVAGAGTG